MDSPTFKKIARHTKNCLTPIFGVLVKSHISGMLVKRLYVRKVQYNDINMAHVMIRMYTYVFTIFLFNTYYTYPMVCMVFTVYTIIYVIIYIIIYY